ncbi:hypothetical protein Pyn_19778 [Prunus yedoensis var. nudiflora]|uniref:Uncharacterized protein n=1 Tax=Prunus yedoensis var. nudiflora TaxID=2094558 RepID=A0A314YWJ5_PRUYE|nr:hypothetical protein Pyn_19778 [Prunus yedoensis var. nudiflora]
MDKRNKKPSSSRKKEKCVENIPHLNRDYDRSCYISTDQNVEGRLVCTWGGGPKAWPVPTIRFSPNGQLILSGGLDNEIRLWDVAEADECINIYKAHRMANLDIVEIYTEGNEITP